MKIINRKAFLDLPANVVFSKYKPCIFDDLCIKGETIGNDFWYQPLNDAIACSGSGERFAILTVAQETGIEMRLDLRDEFRDGMFDNDQLFAVWNAEDVVALINRLADCPIN